MGLSGIVKIHLLVAIGINEKESILFNVIIVII